MGFKTHAGDAVSARLPGPVGADSPQLSEWDEMTRRLTYAGSAGLVMGETTLPLTPLRVGARDYPEVTKEELRKIAPKMAAEISNSVEALNNAMREFDINTRLRQAMFLANICEESGGLRVFKEAGGPKYLQAKKYYPYIGRGLIHLTWKENYQQAADALEIGEKQCEPDKKKGKRVIKGACHYDGLTGGNIENAADPKNMCRIAGWFWTERSNANSVIGDRPKTDLSDFLASAIKVNGKNKDGYPNGWGLRLGYYKLTLDILEVEGREDVLDAIDKELERLAPKKPAKPAAAKQVDAAKPGAQGQPQAPESGSKPGPQ